MGKFRGSLSEGVAELSRHVAGCTFFDTAEAYGQQLYWLGHNEELVGKALAPVRDEVAMKRGVFVAKTVP